MNSEFLERLLEAVDFLMWEDEMPLDPVEYGVKTEKES